MTTTLPFGRSRLHLAACRVLLPLAALTALLSSTAFAQGGPGPCVPDANIAPVIQNVLEGQTVTLNGQPSTPSAISYAWLQLSGPAVTLNSSTLVKPVFVAPNVGTGGATVVMRLTVKCNSSTATNSTTTTINIADVTPVNYPPVAGAVVSPVSALEGQVVSLDGSSSSDPENDALTYAWVQISGTPVTLLNPNTAVASFVAPNTAYPAGDSLGFRLTVSDASQSDDIDVISNIVWQDDPPTAALSCPLSVDEGATLTLDGSGSFDTDDGISTYAWEQVLGPPNVDLSAYSTASISFTAPSLGTGQLGEVRFKLTVTDGAGQQSSEQCTLLINDVTAPVLSGAVDQEIEATSSAGAVASYSVSALDNVDGPSDAICLPVSGSTFPLGDTTVDCSQSDSAGNTGYASFTVTVVDTTAPIIDSHGDVTEEATSAAGAIVNYTSPATSDAYDGAGTATCSPASGTQFAIATTPVTCDATDSNGNAADSTTFNVIVADTTAPSITPPADVTVEATGPLTVVAHGTATGTDAVGPVTITSDAPASFPVGTTTIHWLATDFYSNSSSATSLVTVEDTTPPVVDDNADQTLEATSAAGAVATFDSPAANDIVDGALASTCDYASGATFPLTTTTVTCSATDNAGNTGSSSFTITVEDTTPPTISAHGNETAEATGPSGAGVNYANPTASDIVDGSVAVNCTPASGSTFALGTTTVNCSATDAAGNTASSSFTVTVQDTTAPVIAFHADVNALATSASGAVATYTLPTASDLVDGSVAVTCAPVSGSTFAVGTTTVNCSATDAAGNTGSSSFKVIVSYNFTGFFKPIDNLPIVNVVKAGQAIPVKFSLGGNMGLAIMAAGYPRSVAMTCAGGLQDAVEETVTAGSSSLSYDPTTGQYIYVWKSDKAWASTCRQLQVKLADGTYHYANFSFTR